MQHNYIANQLMAMSDALKQYDSVELQMIAMSLTNIGAEIRKHAPRVITKTVAHKLPEPRRLPPDDGGEKVPAGKPTPRQPSPSVLEQISKLHAAA